jgi:hypothetical protein
VNTQTSKLAAVNERTGIETIAFMNMFYIDGSANSGKRSHYDYGLNSLIV